MQKAVHGKMGEVMGKRFTRAVRFALDRLVGKHNVAKMAPAGISCRNWRGVEGATDVLSFATRNASGRHLGDIVLADETIKREAHRARKPFAHHLAHLAVHGFLHLLGYDHESDVDARVMETAERTILRKLAVPDPYRVDGRSTAGNDAKRAAKRRGRKPSARRPERVR